MPRTDAIYLTFQRLNFVTGTTPESDAAWNTWFDDKHLKDACSALGAWAATRWKVANVVANGPQYATVYLIAGSNGTRGVVKLQEELPKWWEAGRMHPRHTTIMSALVEPYGDFAEVPVPSSRVRGHHLVFSASNDPRKTAEWDEWYQKVHSPDAVSTGAFTRFTRCRRVMPQGVGGMELYFTHLTIYDIESDEVEKTDALAGSRIEQWRAAGRIHPNMSGTYNLLLKPTGKWAGKGFTP